MTTRPANPGFCILGIDPGLSGAMAFYFPSEPGSITAEDLPIMGKEIDAAALARRIAQMRPDVAVIENVHSMPKQGVASSFAFGRAFGTAIGVVAGAGVPLHYAAPTKWKKHYGLGSDKEASRTRAIHFWPSSSAFGRKKDDGRAEAALLARYAAETIAAAGAQLAEAS